VIHKCVAILKEREEKIRKQQEEKEKEITKGAK